MIHGTLLGLPDGTDYRVCKLTLITATVQNRDGENFKFSMIPYKSYCGEKL